MTDIFLDECERYFGERNLYALFALPRNAPQIDGSYSAI